MAQKLWDDLFGSFAGIEFARLGGTWWLKALQEKSKTLEDVHP